jgi:branched-chain amino acid transport system permease protein
MWQQLVNGLALGSIYGLVAVSFSMVYGIVRLINFAFGPMFMFGAYIAAFFLGGELSIVGSTRRGPDFGLVGAICVAMVGVGLLGWLIERIAYRPLRHAPPISSLITVLAVAVFLEGAGFFLFGTQELPFPRDNFFGEVPFHFGSVVVNRVQVVMFVVSIVLDFGVPVVLRPTIFGLKTKACAQDIRVAELQGINSNQVIVSTFMIGSMVAALAGVIWAALFNFLYPTMGFLPSLIAMVAAVLGGIGNIPGALLGGLVLGVVQSLGVAYIPGLGGFGNGFPFAVLILLLWLKPEGLLGSPAVSRPGSVERPLRVFARSPRRAGPSGKPGSER